MKKRSILPILLLLPVMGLSDDTPSFDELFSNVVNRRLDLCFFQDAPYNPSDYQLTTTNAPVWAAISVMSNRVGDAVAHLPSILTNDLQRDAFLLMAGHAGTNAFFQVWNGLLDIAETNNVAVSPETIDSFCLAATTPLDCYVVFFHAEPSVHSLLERTRDLFPTNSEKRTWYDRTLSGAVETELRTYLMDSGTGLPWFAQ